MKKCKIRQLTPAQLPDTQLLAQLRHLPSLFAFHCCAVLRCVVWRMRRHWFKFGLGGSDGDDGVGDGDVDGTSRSNLPLSSRLYLAASVDRMSLPLQVLCIQRSPKRGSENVSFATKCGQVCGQWCVWCAASLVVCDLYELER